MTNNFYKAFEDLHRGSRKLITERLKIYLPFIEPLKKLYPNAQAIDLGCGRGEWLELLQENGINAQGVDLDEGMLSYCRQAKLKVELKDALSALKELPDSSQITVSGFHLAEHIAFEDLQTLVKESFRVLLPAGLLILETPNPENISVGSTNFYLDPSHIRPLPPLLLSFLPQYYGFSRVKIVRLQESINPNSGNRISIHDILAGTSADYSVIAQKDAEPSKLTQVSGAFDQEYGVTLSQAVALYQDQQEAHLEQRNQEVQAQLNHIEQRNQEVQAQLNHIERQVIVINRILAPLIWIYNQLRLVRDQGLKTRFKAALKKVLRIFFRKLNITLRHFPRLHSFFVKIAIKLNIASKLNRLISSPAPIASASQIPKPLALNTRNEETEEPLPAKTQEILNQLNSALNQQQRESS